MLLPHVACALLLACGPVDHPEEQEDSGPCEFQASDPRVDFAMGKGADYHIVEEGEELQLVFGSQAGMEARVVVETSGVPLNEVEYSEVELLVEDFPIAQMEILAEDCSCVDEIVKMDAPMLVDVVPHPTVKSVLQLSRREAELVVRIYDGAGVMYSTTTPVILLT